MSEKRTPDQEVARFVTELSYKDIPKNMIDLVKLDIIDTLGCGFYGSTSPHAKLLRNLVIEFGGKEESTIWGTKLKSTGPHAAMCNSMSVHAYDFDDCGCGGHPGGPILSASLAMAEKVGNINGEQMLAAMVAGFEVMNRINIAIDFRSLTIRGWYVPGINAHFGANVAAGKIFGLNKEETVRSLGLIATSAGGLYSGTVAKRYNTARGVMNAIYAVLLAAKGLESPPNALSAEYSGFITTLADKPDPAALTEGLGTWTSKYSFMVGGQEIAFKPYPCIRSNHPALQALEAMVKKHPEIKPEAIDKVDIGADKVTVVYATGKGLLPKVDTVGAALISLPFAAAAMLAYGEVGVDVMTDVKKIRNPVVQELIKKVNVYTDPEIDKIPELWVAHATVDVKVTLKDGRTFREYLPGKNLKGNPTNPMTKEEVYSKYRGQSLKVLKENRVKEIIKTVEGIEKMKNVAELASLLVP